jgi:DNA repair exonuclease SbcCD ATPase subunit
MFLAPPVRAQDEKDREIEKLKAIIAAQQKNADRLVAENELLRKAIAEREKANVQLETKANEYKQKAVEFEARAKTLQLRLENLLEELRGQQPLPKEDRKIEEPNPPAAKLEGKVSKVAGRLVELNLGTDHGLKEGHTLEVYRLDPMPKYIGRIRITDARHTMAVGRMIGKELPKEGDQVTSKLK